MKELKYLQGRYNARVYIWSNTTLGGLYCNVHITFYATCFGLFPMGHPQTFISEDVVTYNCNFVTCEISYFQLKMICCLVGQISRIVYCGERLFRLIVHWVVLLLYWVRFIALC
jgi:hypothetical protein